MKQFKTLKKLILGVWIMGIIAIPLVSESVPGLQSTDTPCPPTAVGYPPPIEYPTIGYPPPIEYPTVGYPVITSTKSPAPTLFLTKESTSTPSITSARRIKYKRSLTPSQTKVSESLLSTPTLYNYIIFNEQANVFRSTIINFYME